MIYHLDGGTMRPVGGRLMNDSASMCCHVAAFVTESGVAIVDTGVGAAARRDPVSRLGQIARVLRADTDPDTTVAAQLQRLGVGPVTDILITHLDIDHASALDEFPDARVHLHRVELDAALKPSLRERSRYVAANWAHGPDWQPFDTPDDTWNGFDAITLLGGAVKALPLPGHSRGHTAYAIADGDDWFLHAGDCFYDMRTITPGARASRYLQVFERVAAAQPSKLADNHARLTEVARRDDVTVACTHDPRGISSSA